MSIIFSIIVFILVLGLVIVIHELGHFIMAKRANILCHEFSLGMGPILWSKRGKETLYTIRAIPIGGYVMMAGEEIEDEVVKVGSEVRIIVDDFNIITKIVLDHADERYEQYEKITVTHVDLRGKNNEPLYLNDYTVKRNAFYVYKKRELQIAPYERSFESKTKTERFLAIFAGPFMNFVLAVFVFIIINLFMGFPVIDNSVIGGVGEDFPAYEKLKSGDIIVSIEGEPVSDWDDISDEINNNVHDRLLQIEVLRDGETKTFAITPVLIFYSLGFRSSDTTVDKLIIDDTHEDSLAYDAGFIGGDEILTINGEVVITWFDVINIVNDNNEITDETTNARLMIFTVLRDDSIETLTITPHNKGILEYSDFLPVENFIGISPEYEFHFIRSFTYSFTNTKESAGMIFSTLDLLFTNDDVGASDLAGPVGIYTITSNALSGGFLSLLGWVALLSVNLGVINLLPIPALDGGRLVFLGYETITTKKPNKKVENTLHYAMYLMLMGLFVYITFYDLLRLFD